MNYIDNDMVKEYVNIEIENLKNDIENNKKFNNFRTINEEQEEIRQLERLSDEDIEKITQKVNNDEELQNKINEIVKYWLYHR